MKPSSSIIASSTVPVISQLNTGALTSGNLTANLTSLNTTAIAVPSSALTAAGQNQASSQTIGSQVILLAQPANVIGKENIGGNSDLLMKNTSDSRISVKTGQTEGSTLNLSTNPVAQSSIESLKAAGGNVYSLTVNNGNAVTANRAVVDNGRVFLTGSPLKGAR